jgi:ankyrin repeat protein
MQKPSKTVAKLRDAVYAKDLSAVLSALKKVPDADAEPVSAISDRSVLMAAVASDAPLAIVQALVEKGAAKPDFRTKKGETPISVAHEKERRDVLEYFQSRGYDAAKFVAFVDLPQEEKNRRFVAVVKDWTDDALATKLARHLQEGAAANTLVFEKYYAVHYLCRHGVSDLDAYRVLVEGKVPLRNAEGKTPLHVLAEDADRVEVVEYLASQVDINAKDDAGNTALHYAIRKNAGAPSKFIAALVAAGADPHLTNHDGKAPLDFAKTKLAAQLGKPTPRLSAATTALFEAISRNDAPAALEALAAAADPNQVDVSDRSWGIHKNQRGVAAVHLACTYRVSQEVFDAVLSYPLANVNVRSEEDKWTPLHYVLAFAQSSPWQQRCERLFARGADANATDVFGRGPLFRLGNLHRAADQIEAFRLLVAQGADPMLCDRDGESVLDAHADGLGHFPDIRNKPEFVSYLVFLVQSGVQGRMLDTVLSWLASTGSKYADVSAVVSPDAARARAEKRRAAREAAHVAFARIAGEAFDEHRGKHTTLALNGKSMDVALFDWFVLLQEGEDDENASADEILENQVDPARAADVEALRCIPLGVLGMTGDLESYDDLGAQGVLYLRLDRAAADDAPVFVDNGSFGDDEDEEDDSEEQHDGHDAQATSVSTFKSLFATLRVQDEA